MFLSDCANAIWSLKGLRPSSFCLGFFFVKKVNHIAKVTNILHFKLCNNSRPSYFSISTPLRHTSPSIYSMRLIFDMTKYKWPITRSWLSTWIDFGHVVWTNLTSYKFSFPFFISLYMCLLIKFCRVKKIIYIKKLLFKCHHPCELHLCSIRILKKSEKKAKNMSNKKHKNISLRRWRFHP
jgi:hypothetical protein